MLVSPLYDGLTNYTTPSKHTRPCPPTGDSHVKTHLYVLLCGHQPHKHKHQPSKTFLGHHASNCNLVQPSGIHVHQRRSLSYTSCQTCHTVKPLKTHSQSSTAALIQPAINIYCAHHSVLIQCWIGNPFTPCCKPVLFTASSGSSTTRNTLQTGPIMPLPQSLPHKRIYLRWWGAHPGPFAT